MASRILYRARSSLDVALDFVQRHRRQRVGVRPEQQQVDLAVVVESDRQAEDALDDPLHHAGFVGAFMEAEISSTSTIWAR